MGKIKPFRLSECNEEFLKYLTRINAELIYSYNGSPDHYRNWIEGRKLTALSIIDSFVAECKKKGTICPFLPICCESYIREININELKKKVAYFIWEEKGKKQNFIENMRRDYFEACEYILPVPLYNV